MARKPAFIRHSPEREFEIQSRMLDVLEAHFRRGIAKGIADRSMSLIRRYEILGEVPLSNEVDYSAMRDVYFDIALRSARTFGKRIIDQGKSLGLIEKKDVFGDFFRSLAMAWIQQEAIRMRIVQVNETTRRRIVAEVEKGQREGLGTAEIGRRIAEQVPDISLVRGTVIARTETHGAANYAMHETAKSTGLDLQKRWTAVRDHRTRSIGRDDQFDHVMMDGQTRAMDEPFEMPWTGSDEPIRIMFPGEAGHPGGATINCRCVAVHFVEGDDD